MKNYTKILLALFLVISFKSASARTIDIITKKGCATDNAKVEAVKSKYSKLISDLIITR